MSATARPPPAPIEFWFDFASVYSYLSVMRIEPLAHSFGVPVHWKPRLRQQTEAARGRGIFGAPTFFAGREMFWGNDRLEEALTCAAKEPPPAWLPDS